MAMNQEKFKALVHYICWKCEDPRKLGAIRLNKIIWYAEKIAFLRLGESMTGARFVKRELGPVPKAILPVLDELQESKAIAIREARFLGKPREFISLVDPNIKDFSAMQISLIDSVIDEICNHHTATSISQKSHDEIWDLAELGEEIPLYTVFGARGEITEVHMKIALAELEGRGVLDAAPSTLPTHAATA